MKVTSLIIVGLIVLVAGLASAKGTRWHQLSEEYSFDQYSREFHKSYAHEEDRAMHKDLFESRLRDILSFNAFSGASWKKGVNKFTDRTEQERRQVLGLDKTTLYARNEVVGTEGYNYQASTTKVADLANVTDWRDEGVITSVKDQGGCGSCYTFGTTETIESHSALFNEDLFTLSEQHALDCTPNPNQCGGTGGCGGGTAEQVYEMIMQAGGQATEWTYPYTSYFGQDYPCHFNASLQIPMVAIQNYTKLPSNQYEPVMETLATVGPLVINVDASQWFEYEEGVYDGCNQTNPDIDHVVQLVGYGNTTTDGAYWIVRNSWDTNWGELGYIRLVNTGAEDLRCGIDITPQDGTGCKNGPPQVKACGTCAMLYDVSYPLMEAPPNVTTMTLNTHNSIAV